MKTAWLITWEWIAEHAKKDSKIVSILNYRLSGLRVREYVERRYVDSEYNLREQLSYAKSPKNNPYPAEFGKINGVSWQDQIICGHNPYLEARKVKNIRVEVDSNGEEHLEWEEIPPPKLPKLRRP